MTSFKELNSVLNFIVNKKQANLLYNDSIPLSTISDVKSNHESVTVVEDIVLETNGYQLKQTRKIYFTEDASYYESNGTLTYISSSNSGDDDDNGDYNYYHSRQFFDFQIYIDDETALIKINQYSLFGESIKDEYANKWLELPEDDFEYINKFLEFPENEICNLHNSVSFESLYVYLNEIIEKDYKLEEKRFSGTSTSITGYETNVKISFTDTENPTIEIAGPPDNAKNNINLFKSFTFSNIDNTTIKSNAKKATEIDSLGDIFKEEN